MSACEKCWSDAYAIAYHTGRSQVDVYHELLKERNDTPCSPEEQRGDRLHVERP